LAQAGIPAGSLPFLVESLSASTMTQYGGFQPAMSRLQLPTQSLMEPSPYTKADDANYGATEQVEDAATTTVNKKSFRRGVAMSHTFMLFAVFIPPFMLCLQMAHNQDLEYFVGTFVAHLAYVAVLIILLVPMAHLAMRLHPWAFLLTVWIPAFTFVVIGWYYRDYAGNTFKALQSTDCVGFAEKRDLQQSYELAQNLYNKCHKSVSYSIEECPQYPEVFEMAPADFTYLKALEQRFQCSGICFSGRRLWESAGVSAPACGLFAAQWVRGSWIEAQFVLWYSVIVLMASIPIFITLLDSFFKDYYQPLAK